MSDVIRLLTKATRKADQSFEQGGGNTRCWVIEYFLPALEEEGLQIVVNPKQATSEATSEKL